MHQFIHCLEVRMLQQETILGMEYGNRVRNEWCTKEICTVNTNTWTTLITKDHIIKCFFKMISRLICLLWTEMNARPYLRNKTSVPVFYHDNKIWVCARMRMNWFNYTHPNSYPYFITDVLFRFKHDRTSPMCCTSVFFGKRMLTGCRLVDCSLGSQ